MLHAFPLRGATRWLGGAAAGTVSRRGRPSAAAAGAAARREQRCGAPRPAVRVRAGAAGDLSVRRLAGGGPAAAATGREREGQGTQRAADAQRRHRELQRELDGAAGHRDRDAAMRVRGRAAADRRERPGGGGGRRCAAARTTLPDRGTRDRKSTRLNSSHLVISYAVFCLKKKKKMKERYNVHRTIVQ